MRTPELTDTTIIHALMDDPENALLNVRRVEDVMDTLDRLHVEMAMRAQMLYRRHKGAGK